MLLIYYAIIIRKSSEIKKRVLIQPSMPVCTSIRQTKCYVIFCLFFGMY